MKILFSYTYKIKSKVYQKKLHKHIYKQKLSTIDLFLMQQKWQLKFLRINYLRSYFLLHTFFIHLALFIVNLNDSVKIDCCKSIKPVFI